MTGGNTRLRHCAIHASPTSHSKISLIATKGSPGGCKLTISFGANIINRKGRSKYTLWTQGRLCWVFFMPTGKGPTSCQFMSFRQQASQTSLQAAAAMVDSGDEQARVAHASGCDATPQCSTGTSRLPGTGLGHFQPAQEDSVPGACLFVCWGLLRAQGPGKKGGREMVLQKSPGDTGACVCQLVPFSRKGLTYSVRWRKWFDN